MDVKFVEGETPSPVDRALSTADTVMKFFPSLRQSSKRATQNLVLKLGIQEVGPTPWVPVAAVR